MGLRDDADDRWLKEMASKKRKEIGPSLFPHLAGSQLVISMAEWGGVGLQSGGGGGGGAEQIRERICHLLASMITDCCATGPLITIKRALSHTLFLLVCLLSTAQGGLHTQTHKHAHSEERLQLAAERNTMSELLRHRGGSQPTFAPCRSTGHMIREGYPPDNGAKQPVPTEEMK